MLNTTYLMFSAKNIALVYLFVQGYRFSIARLFTKHSLQLVELGVLVRICFLRLFIHLNLKIFIRFVI